MALTDASADSAAAGYVDDQINGMPDKWFEGTPGGKGALRPIMLKQYQPLFRAIFASIASNAVVTPNGTPTAMNVGGTAVAGTGRVT